MSKREGSKSTKVWAVILFVVIPLFIILTLATRFIQADAAEVNTRNASIDQCVQDTSAILTNGEDYCACVYDKLYPEEDKTSKAAVEAAAKECI